jgi:hypothetical protein
MKNLTKFLCIVTMILSSTACTPKFDWREIRNSDAPFVATFPGKPASHTRDIDLDGIKVKLHMLGSDVNQISFAIAYAKIENSDKDVQAAHQQRVLSAMQTGMLKNIQAKIIQPTPVDAPKNTLTAIGKTQKGQMIKMIARFTQNGPWVIQVVMLGEEKSFTPEIADMFFGSVKLN